VKAYESVILNFHGIGPILRQVGERERNCWLDLGHFLAILDLVRNLPHVIMTFDDGNLSDVEISLPALSRRGLTATFFICSGRVDRPSFLCREHIRQLQTQGMYIGSHGIAHRQWTGLKPQELGTELRESRRALENICGVPIVGAACPFGEYDRSVLRELRLAGYRRVYTSDGGWASENSFLMARNTICRSTSLEDVALLINRKPSWLSQVGACARRLLKQSR
jgi:peptidoglycan/xylan/chitin deacetylase (PgdA/CDA1 family)